MKNGKNIIAILIGLLLISTTFGQQENNKDQALRGSGRVNPSTLAMEFDLPLGNYQGRGINVPISLSYSSKVWRAEYINSQSQGNNPSNCISLNSPKFAEHSASGWTTSMSTPYIEYTGWNNIFTDEGNQISGCIGSQPHTNYHNNALVKRINVHLPSGESHELRMDDLPYVYPTDGSPIAPNGTFYAVDGSNIKYIEDAANNIYKLQMPDGSFYTFKNTREYYASAGSDVRKAEKFTDRNGNFTTYNQSNGTWTDTLGRTIQIPFGTNSPAQPTVQTYSLPGMTGTYKFHWKKLKNTTAAESGLTDFSQNLKYMADKSSPDPNGPIRTEALFFSGFSTWIHDEGAPIFNPVVLTGIELPNGQIYKFSYDIYGRIDRIEYPTGGKEHFDYDKILPLAPPTSGENISDQMNFGVIKRKVFVGGGSSSFYEWNYGVSVVQPRGYKISVTNPDGTINQRFLHRGGDTAGLYGYENSLAGMAYETRGFDSQGNLVSRSRTHWTKSTFGIGNTNIPADWHPRVTHEENYIYDSTGNGVYATTKFEYEGDLSQHETPVLRKKTLEYNFVAADGNSLSSIQPGNNPDSNPLPVPTPNPPTLARTTELTYLINDPTYAGVQAYYKNQNMVGLVTASVVKDASGNPVSRSEMKYDDAEFSPAFRGNPTTSRVWDNTKGDWDDPSAYISTRAKFDIYGNQYEAIDAKGNSTFTTFDSTHHAFPIQVTTTAPDPSGQNGSNTGFTTTSTFDPITGLPLKTIDANGLETRIEYDWVTLRPKNTKNFYQNNQVGGMVETIYHDEPNNYWVKSRSQIDNDKWAESITYFDGLGRAYKSEEVNSKGNIYVEKEFDADGRVYRVTNPFRNGEAKAWTTNIYDNSSRVIEVILPDGAKVKTDYGVSVAGAKISTIMTVTDQAGKQRRSLTNALGQIIRVDEPNDAGQLGTVDAPTQPTDYAYDILNNLLTVNQGVQTRSFVYDSLSRLKSANNPESGTINYSYDNNGNLTSKTDGRNVSVNYNYDALNRVTQRSYAGETGYATPSVFYFYDNLPNAKGKLIKVSNLISTTEYTSFDILGRVSAHKQMTDGQTYTTNYNYALSGALVEQTYPSGRVVKNTLDENGDLAKVESKKNASDFYRNYATSFVYTAVGALSSLRLGNGKFENTVYNSRLQPVQIGLGSSATTQDLLKLNFDYGTTDNNGNVKSQTITVPTVGNVQVFTALQTYSYDSLNRIKQAAETINNNQNWKQTFSYDRYGNRRFDEANTTTLLQNCPTAVCNPQVDAATNKLVGYTFDSSGNTKVDPQNRTFIYDGENKQVEVKDADGNSIGRYFYDGDGRRVKKMSLTETTVFVYDAIGQLVSEHSTQLSNQPQTAYLTADHLGSPRINTNAAGQVISRHDYQPFGEEIVRTNYGMDDVRKKFTGYERDSETDLDFAQARYYAKSYGRFTTTDPLLNSASVINPQSFNRYLYVQNNPLIYTDPTGMICCSESEEALLRSIVSENLNFVTGDSPVKLDDASRQKLIDSIMPFARTQFDLSFNAQNALNSQTAAGTTQTVTTETNPTTVDIEVGSSRESAPGAPSKPKSKTPAGPTTTSNTEVSGTLSTTVAPGEKIENVPGDAQKQNQNALANINSAGREIDDVMEGTPMSGTVLDDNNTVVSRNLVITEANQTGASILNAVDKAARERVKPVVAPTPQLQK